MNAINKITSLTLSLFVMLAYGNSLAKTPDISGTYTCSGQDPLSSTPAFSEKIVIKKNGDTYSLQMFGTNSVLPYDLGTAIVNDKAPNAFSYVYWSVKDSSSFGTELFIVKPDGSLDGVFTDSNKNQPGTETCKKAAT